VLVAPAALLVWSRHWRVRMVWPVAAALSLAAAVLVIGGRDNLTSFTLTPSPGGPPAAQAPPTTQDPSVAEANSYLHTVAADFLRRYGALAAGPMTTVATALSNPATDRSALAAYTRTELLLPLRGLLADMESHQPATPPARSAHGACLAFVRITMVRYVLLAGWLETDDPVTGTNADAERELQQQQYDSCISGLRTLRAAVPASG